MGQLKGNNLSVSHELPDSNTDIVIINTCGFIEKAKEESINTILHYAKQKHKGKVQKVFVTGCLSERYKNDLEKEIPLIDSYFGTTDLPNLLKTLGATYKHELIGERCLSTPHHYAYLKISEGCNRSCSFCAIPLMRGKHVSKPIDQLIQEAKNLAKKGVRELILIAQDASHYGLDIYKKRRLADLMKYLSDVDGIEWIRLHYAYPSGFPLEVLDVIKERNNICNYLDIPLQHINDDLLKSMRRGTNKKKTNALLQTIREKVPDIAIRTTLIAGYPGETDKEHEELKEWVRQVRFDRLGIFTYSHEENTHAYALNDCVSEDIKQERADAIMQIQQEISLQKNQNKIGKTYKVLFDRKEGGYFVGRTEHDSPEVDNEVLLDASEQYVRTGDFANILITKVTDYDLYGTFIPQN